MTRGHGPLVGSPGRWRRICGAHCRTTWMPCWGHGEAQLQLVGFNLRLQATRFHQIYCNRYKWLWMLNNIKHVETLLVGHQNQTFIPRRASSGGFLPSLLAMIFPNSSPAFAESLSRTWRSLRSFPLGDATSESNEVGGCFVIFCHQVTTCLES